VSVGKARDAFHMLSLTGRRLRLVELEGYTVHDQGTALWALKFGFPDDPGLFEELKGG